MSDTKRRDFLKATAGVAAGSALGAGSALWTPEAMAQQYKVTPEKGATLRVLRWKRFVQGDEDVWAANTKKFTEMTGIPVRVDAEGWEDVRPKAAVAANVGSGPDIIISTMEDAHQYPEKLVDVTDLANYLGNKYGGWYPLAKDYAMHGNKWVAIMMGAAGNAIVYRESAVKAAGFDTVPRDMAGFLKLCQALKAKGTPAGFALGNATGDSSWTHWLVWAHGGKLVDAKNNVVINSPETIAALEYSKQLYETFIPGTLSWLDPNNNKAFLDGQLFLTANGISVYYAAKTSQDPKMQGTGQRHPARVFPGGAGRQVARAEPRVPDDDLQVHQVSECGEGIPALHDGEGAVRAVAGGLDRLRLPSAGGVREERVLDGRSQEDAVSRLLQERDARRLRGQMGYASAACVADFIIPNMVAEAASGSKTPKEAAERAQKRAERYYKV